MRRQIGASLAMLALTLGSLPAEADGSFLGIPAELIGQHGPTEDFLDGLDVVGRSNLALPGQPVLGNHGGIALIGDCLYVGRWHDYRGRNPVAIVDISDPATPAPVGTVPGSTRAGGVAREIRAVDLPGRQLLIVMTFGQNTGDRANNHLEVYAPVDGDCRNMSLVGSFDMRAFRGHEFFVWLDEDPAIGPAPRILIVVTAPVGPPNVLVVDASDPSAPTLVGLFDAGQPVVSADEAAGTYLGSYAHSISISDDGSEAYLSYWDGGFFTLDASALTAVGGTFAPAGAMSVPLRHPGGEKGNVHSAVPVPGTDTVVVGHEIYGSTDGCPYGWLKTIDKGSASETPTLMGEFRLDANLSSSCVPMPGIAPPIVGEPRLTVNARNSLGELIDGTFTMHNQTVVGSFVLASWYGAGLRIVDVADPEDPVEAASFVPAPLAQDPHPVGSPQTSAPIWGAFGTSSDDWHVAMWSYPIVRDGLIYVCDMRNGLYVLRAEAGSALAEALDSVSFAEGNSNLGSLR